MRRFLAWIMLSAVLAGCSGAKDEKPPSQAGGTPGSSAAGPRGSMADILPADTQGYFRLANVQAVRRNFIQKDQITDAAAIQRALDKFLDESAKNGPEDNGPFDMSAPTAYAVFNAARSIHIAAVPAKNGYDWDGPGGKEPEISDRPTMVMIVEVDSMEAVDAHLKKMGDKVQAKDVKGLKVYTRKKNEWRVFPEALAKLDDHTLVYAEADSAMERVLETKAAGAGGSLGQDGDFRDAYQAMGDKGDLFAFVSFDKIRMKEPDVPKTLSSLAGYADVAGELTIRVKTGSDLPDLLAAGPKEKRLLGRIPAEAVYVTDGTFKGGKEARDAFNAWLKSELESPTGLGQIFPGKVREQMVQSLENAKTAEQGPAGDPAALLAALPMKSESAMFVAPDQGGKWGLAALGDIDDKAKAESTVEKLKDLAKGAPIPINWENKDAGGTAIHYVDIAKILPPGFLPDDLKKRIDFQVGYAVSNDLLAVGTAGALEFVLQPSGSTYADRIQWKGVDRENTALLSLAPGAAVNQKFGIPQVDDTLARIAKEIPRDARYAVTLNVEKRQATLRTNAPITSLIGWLVVEFNTDDGPAKLKDLMPRPEPRPMPVPLPIPPATKDTGPVIPPPK